MKYCIYFLLFTYSFLSQAQYSSSELFVEAKKLSSLKRVLYVAAHPDDENTRALSWLSLGEEAQTAYFSLTRGDGGQNLIGNELGAGLGILRSQELLAARSIDHSTQFFSRAVDFGFSKSAEESFEKWGKEEMLKDAVTIIRTFKPEVILTRFPPDERAGHGHHTASAMLAIEAMEKAADKNYLPNQVKELGTWQTTSLYWNASNWWNKDIDSIAKDNPDYLVFDIGGYNAALGKSYNEIGTLARSQHKCQGFGAIIERGERKEYFQHLAGKKLKNSFFEESIATWETHGVKALDAASKELIANFNFIEPSKNVKALLKIYTLLDNIKDEYLKKEKKQACSQLIQHCLGLYVELLSDEYSVVKETIAPFSLEVINRSNTKVQLKELVINGSSYPLQNSLLGFNIPFQNKINLLSPSTFYTPYWLDASYSNLYQVTDKNNIGKPESSPSFSGYLTVEINTVEVQLPISGEYKWSDPSYGERRREVFVSPKLAVTMDKSVVIAKKGNTSKVKITVKNLAQTINEAIQIKAPKGWEITPSSIQVTMDNKYQEQFFEVEIKPMNSAEKGILQLTNASGERLQYIHEITYDHIPTQVYFSDAEIELVALDVKIVPGKIGYIKGVEESVPQALEQLGYEVVLLNVADIASTNLKDFTTIVTGIRVYNVHPELINHKKQLMTYVEEGGNLLVQYNTATSSIKSMEIGPYPFTISRERVTEEDAVPKFLNPNHPVLQSPNAITTKDFEGWVQERGLYFANTWEDKYEPILAWNDRGEQPLQGGLLIANYGKGTFMYTGISFFRELPQGVDGAYRLFANLISYRSP